MTNTTLSGTIPQEIGQAKKLQHLLLSSSGLSGLSGFIPEEIGNLADLRIFHLEGNRFGGPIPKSMANLTKLERFSASQNSLRGSLVIFFFSFSTTPKFQVLQKQGLRAASLCLSSILFVISLQPPDLVTLPSLISSFHQLVFITSLY